MPHEPNPVCIISDTARIAICGQAPGIRVHNTSLPFNDPSGDRLRQWLGTTREEFYDPSLFAIVPMGFCFPGYDKHGGDLPPRRECRLTWHDRVFASMPQLEFILVVGQYSLAYHLPEWRKTSLTETVQNWRSFIETPNAAGRIVLPLPHPSWRNSGWLKRNPWFDAEVVPVLHQKIRRLINPGK
ncbi:uracil DNA glycosylase superfamily protein [Brucella thiophenivorans]|uniref:Uracil DNA glycosylase superfamily protein n=1 Tax=Brucella thiophenivorans TaxID=571255 RepID=A0A256FVW0_9HYPH|nr:uracil DNA glycosylase superfamily protein [Brucella thiophenivorans]